MKAWFRRPLFPRWPRLRRWHLLALPVVLYITGPDIQWQGTGSTAYCPPGTTSLTRDRSSCVGRSSTGIENAVLAGVRFAPGDDGTFRQRALVASGRDVFVYVGLRTPRLRLFSIDFVGPRVEGFEALR